MKLLVVGAGSIGGRHLKNLVELGHEVYAVDVNPASLDKVSGLAAKTFTRLEEGLRTKPDAAFICTYSNDHIPPAVVCARAGCHLFIEKPLSLTTEGTEELISTIQEQDLISMVGCNMRFHPALSAISGTLHANKLFSKPLWGNLESGFYLPFDKKDYQNHYKAKRSLGGNLIFDGIHELDAAVWLFGNPKEVVSMRGIISSLKIDTEDHVEMIVRFESGSVCTIHMDYLQHGYSRRCKIVCEEGTIVWDFVNGTLGTVTAETGTWEWTDMKVDLYYNQMFVDEAKYFLDHIRTREQTFNTVEQSLRVLKLAIAAERSCISNQWERVL